MSVGCDSYSEQNSPEKFPRLRETVKLDLCPKSSALAANRIPLSSRSAQENGGAEINRRAGEHAYFGYCASFGTKPDLLDLPTPSRYQSVGSDQRLSYFCTTCVEGDAVPTLLTKIQDRDAAIMRAKMVAVMPAAAGKVQRARELMILLHTELFIIQRDEGSTAIELREFAGQILDLTRITKQ
jgi:hypothetical protein